MAESKGEALELRDYVRILRANWLSILLTTLLGTVVGIAATYLTAPQYEAQAKIYVSVRSDSQASGDLVQGANFARQSMTTFIELSTTESVLQPVIDELELDLSLAELASKMQVSSTSDSHIINVSVVDENPNIAADIANEVGSQLKQVVESQLESPRAGADTSPVELSTVHSAEESQQPISPRIQVNVALGLLLGLAAGVAIALLRTSLDTRIRTVEDIENLTDVPVLGRIAQDPKAELEPLIVHMDPMNPRAEAFRTLRTNVQFLSLEAGPKTFVISSAGPAEGKTTTAANLAIALAETGLRVALLDCDLRRPRVAETMGLEGSIGLTDVLIGQIKPDDVIQRWGRGHLEVLPAGQTPPNPSELLGSAAMDAILDELESRVDMIIVDAPPVLMVTDAAVIGTKTQGVILVAAAGSTRKQALQASIEAIEAATVPVRGVVATMLPVKGTHYYSQGEYSNRYQTQETGASNQVERPRRSSGRRAITRSDQ